MKNLIHGQIYQLKKDHFFFGCLALSCVSLFVSIRLSLSLASVSNPVMGIEGLFDTFLGGNIILYIFMLLTANTAAETYRSGVMKNIVGRGIAKKQYYLSIVFTVSAACVLVMLIGGTVMGVLAGSRFGMGAISYPGYYALSVPKPTDTELYNKMTPFFTIALDNGFWSEHYGTELNGT